MERIAIITDSNSGITQQSGKEMGINVLPMPFYVGEQLFLEDITLSQKEFYDQLADDRDISTSQPSPGDILDLWDSLLTENDYILHIPMSSGLSASYDTAAALSRDYNGRVLVVNNQRISVTQRQAVIEAVTMRDVGKSCKEIKDALESTKLEASIYLTVDTLKYLKKGGRITSAAAALGTVLNLKPVLTIQGEKLDAYAKVRGIKQAKKIMMEGIEKDINDRFGGLDNVNMQVAYSFDLEAANLWKEELSQRFPGKIIQMDCLSLSIACHTGPGAIAVACTKKIL